MPCSSRLLDKGEPIVSTSYYTVAELKKEIARVEKVISSELLSLMSKASVTSMTVSVETATLRDTMQGHTETILTDVRVKLEIGR